MLFRDGCTRIVTGRTATSALDSLVAWTSFLLMEPQLPFCCNLESLKSLYMATPAVARPTYLSAEPMRCSGRQWPGWRNLQLSGPIAGRLRPRSKTISCPRVLKDFSLSFSNSKRTTTEDVLPPILFAVTKKGLLRFRLALVRTVVQSK